MTASSTRGRLRAYLLAMTAAATLAMAPSAFAAQPAVPYASLGVGYGSLSGSRVITTQIPNSADLPVDSGSQGCCPEGGLAMDIRLGVQIYGAVAVEGGLLGQGWSIGSSERGGAGFVGGGVRLYTLGLIELATDPLELPIDLSWGVMFGYAVVGRDFAYSGSFTGFDATLEWHAADFVTLGARANLFIPNYRPFVFTDFNADEGRCLDSSGGHIDAPATIDKADAQCQGSGPSASMFSPQLVATFKFNLF